MPKKSRPLSRDRGVVRDASLVVIASEDKYAVQHYFARFRPRKVQFIVANTEDCRSSPEAVMDRLKNKRREYDVQDGDEFWLCIDRDRWQTRTLSNVLSECRRCGYKVAISHPCFDIWLLLHFEEIEKGSFSSCQDVKSRLRDVLGGGYGTHCCATATISEEMVHRAIARAKSLDDASALPDSNTSQVHRILATLLEKDVLAFT